MPSAARTRLEASANAPPVTRDRILDVAEALFAERGFAGTSMRDIAAAADLTAASLYNHFEGKQALYAAVLDRGIRPLVELMQELASREPDPDAADAVITAVMEHLGRRPHLPRLIHQEAVSGGAHLAGLAREWVRPMLEHGLSQMKRTPGSPWDESEHALVIAAWIQLVLGHFALAPLFAEVLGTDPLEPDMLRRQTEFLRKLAHRIMDDAP